MQKKLNVNEKQLQKDLYYKNLLLCKYNILYPLIENQDDDGFIDILNQYYRQKSRTFQYFAEKNLYNQSLAQYESCRLYDYPVLVYEAIQSYKISLNTSSVLSVFYDQYSYNGGLHGSGMRMSDTWSLNFGTRVLLKELFPGHSDYKKEIQELIVKQIKNQIKNGTHLYFDQPEKRVAEFFQTKNFYLRKNGIVIFYQPYELAPYVNGYPTFFIPFQKEDVLESL